MMRKQEFKCLYLAFTGNISLLIPWIKMDSPLNNHDLICIMMLDCFVSIQAFFLHFNTYIAVKLEWRHFIASWNLRLFIKFNVVLRGSHDTKYDFQSLLYTFRF